MRHVLPRVAAFLLVLCCAGLPAIAQERSEAPAYRHFTIGDRAAKRPGATTPGLMLMGGSDWVKPAFQWFSRHAGHGHVVILRASGGDDLQRRWYDEIGGVASVQTLVFSDRSAASDAFVLDTVARADALFIAGGDQSRYIRFWKGTPLNALIDRHVKDGKPLGGTSAGLAILGHVGYGALDGTSLTSPRALADPLGSSVTLDSGFLDVPFLASVITDTHFARRDRFGRLIVFLARARHDRLIADPLGIGVDENTMLCIEPDGSARVMSADKGLAWFVRLPAGAVSLHDGTPLDLSGVRITAAGESSRVRMQPLSIDMPAFETTATITSGQLRFDPALPVPTEPAQGSR
jgi:cyanophycinase